MATAGNEKETKVGGDIWWTLWKERLRSNGKCLIATPSINFSGISQIDETKQTFYAKFFLKLVIKDADCIIDEIGQGCEGWSPKILFSNSASDVDIKTSTRIIKDKNKVVYYFTVEGEFEDAFDLRMFPWDSQELEVNITTDWDTEFFIISPDESKNEGMTVDLSSNIHTASKYQIEKQVRIYQSHNTSAEYTYCQINAAIFMMRRPWTYIFTVWLRQFIVTSLAFSSFAIGLGAEPARDRLNVVVGLLLTSSLGFKSSIDGLLTWLDSYTTVSFIMLGVILSYHGVGIAQVPNKDLDFFVSYILVFVWIFINVMFFAVALYSRRRGYARKSLWMAKGAEDLFKSSIKGSLKAGKALKHLAASAATSVVDVTFNESD